MANALLWFTSYGETLQMSDLDAAEVLLPYNLRAETSIALAEAPKTCICPEADGMQPSRVKCDRLG